MRGQVTIFVIIGLILMIVAGIFLISSDRSEDQSGRLNTQPVISYVSSCLYQTAKEGLILLGNQGGYYRFDGLSGSEEMPWKSDLLVSGPQKIPYWYYVKDCSESSYGCFVSGEPPLCSDQNSCPISSSGTGSIEEHLEDYITDHINDCLDWESLNLEVNSEGEPKVDVDFTEDDVSVSLDYPLRVTDQNGEETSIESFSTSLDVDFEEVYRLAHEINNLESKTSFVEEYLIHLLTLYSGIDQPIPPFEESQFFGGKKIWVRSEVQKLIENNILPFLDFMQIINAEAGYSPIVLDNKYAEGVYAYGELSLGDESYPGEAVSFLYPYSPIYLNINDREVLKGQSLSTGNLFEKFSGLFLTRYNFKYDISFPIIVNIKQPDAFGGEGYSFSLAIEGNVLNNNPMRPETIPVDLRTQNTDLNINLDSPENYPEAVYRVLVTDRHTGQPLPEASIYYDCGKRFSVGTARLNSNGISIWEGRLPYCPIGGFLVVEKPLEYAREAISLNNDDNSRGRELSFSLWPVKTKKVIVLRRTPLDQNNISVGGDPDIFRHDLVWGSIMSYVVNVTTDFNNSVENSTPVNNETQVTIPFNQWVLLDIGRVRHTDYDENIPYAGALTFGDSSGSLDNPMKQEYLDKLLANGTITQEQYTTYSNEMRKWSFNNINLKRERDIDIVPGYYEINAMLFYNGNLYIPREVRKYCPYVVCPFGVGEKKVVLPAQNFSSWLQGGVDLTRDGLGPVYFSEDDVYSDDPLIVYVLEEPLPRTWKEFEKYQTVKEYQKSRQSMITPEFERIS